MKQKGYQIRDKNDSNETCFEILNNLNLKSDALMIKSIL